MTYHADSATHALARALDEARAEIAALRAGQEALKAQTVRIRRAAGAVEGDGRDTEEIVVALRARVEEAELERDALKAIVGLRGNARAREAEARAQRAETLLGYATLKFPKAWIDRDGIGVKAYRYGATVGTYPDLDSALRALRDAGLLPEDVRRVMGDKG